MTPAETIAVLEAIKLNGVSVGQGVDTTDYVREQLAAQQRNNTALTAAIKALQSKSEAELAWEAVVKLIDKLPGGVLIQKVYVRDSVASYRVAKQCHLTEGGYAPMDTPQSAALAASKMEGVG